METAVLSPVTDTLFSHLIQAFPANRPYPSTAFSQTPMPPPVVHFLKRTLRHRAARERVLDGSAWFDTEHPDVKQAQQALADALTQHARVPADAWEATLRRAVQCTLDHLVRPVATLADFVFERAEPLPASVVLERFQYFSTYGYLREATRMYVEQKRVSRLDRSQLTAVLHRIDRQMTADYGPDEWLRLLRPLFDLFRRPVFTADGVPAELLQAFFRDKGADLIANRLRQVEQEQGRSTFSDADLRQLLVSPAPPEQSTSHEVSAPSPSAPAETTSEPVPLWKQFQQHQKRTHTKVQQQVPSGTLASSTPAASGDARPRWMQFRHGEASGSGDSQYNDLAQLERDVLGQRGAGHRDVFVKHLFSASTDDYTEVLRQLQEAAGWPEASSIIAQEVFQKHQVNIYSEPAVLFTDIVKACFEGDE